MAFQTGSQVRPELGRADLSGFARSGESIGAALASVGKSVGEGFEKYQENKEVTTASLAALEAISVSRPDAYAELRNSDKKIGNILRNIEDGNYKRNDLQSAIGALQTSIAAKDARRASELQDLQLRDAQSKQQQQMIDRDAAGMALSASREAGTGNINTQDAVSAYISQGGRDPNFFNMIESMQPEAGVSSSEAEQEIQRVMAANPDISYTDAVNIKEGITKVVTDPVTNRAFLVNLATNEQRPWRSSEVTDAATSAALSPGADADPSSLNLYQIAENTTGIVPALAAAAQRFTGQIGIDVADPVLLENIQTFKTAQSDIRRSMRTAPKFLASEMAMLDKELDISPDAFKDPVTLLAQLRSVDKSIRNRLRGIAESINDPRLPADEVAAGLRLQKDLINFLRNLGVPQGEESAEVIPPSPELSDIANKYLNQE
jgi:hypothetical protein